MILYYTQKYCLHFQQLTPPQKYRTIVALLTNVDKKNLAEKQQKTLKQMFLGHPV